MNCLGRKRRTLFKTIFNKNMMNIFLKYPTAILGMFLVIQFLGPYTFQAGALELETSVKLNLRESGQTVVHIPPLGRVNASTHSSPLDLHFALKNIHLDQFTELADLDPALITSNLPAPLIDELKTNIIKYIVFLLLLSFCVGTGSALLWWRQRINKKDALTLGGVNVTVLSLFLLFTYFSYDAEAFSQAKYEGMIEATPLVMGVLEEGHKLVGDLGVQFGSVINSVALLQQELDNTSVSAENKNTLSLLHVSDIHNNPAAFQLIRRVLDTYEVDLIIDTGDLVDFGTALELKLMAETLQSLPVPYIFVPGNHDSPAVVEQLKTMQNVTVLEEGMLEKKGLRIAAIADPSAYYQTMAIADEEILEDSARKLQEIVLNNKNIDVIATHNPELFRFLRSDGNLLLGGHIHRSFVVMDDNYLEINAGSSGASGIRGLQNMQNTKMEYSLAIINFISMEEDTAWRPQTIDLLKVNLFPSYFSFERFVLEN